jgi:hypothetical protein
MDPVPERVNPAASWNTLMILNAFKDTVYPLGGNGGWTFYTEGLAEREQGQVAYEHRMRAAWLRSTPDIEEEEREEVLRTFQGLLYDTESGWTREAEAAAQREQILAAAAYLDNLQRFSA